MQESRGASFVARWTTWAGGAASALLAEVGGESDGSAHGSRRVHELADGREDGRNGLVVSGELLLDARLELIDPVGCYSIPSFLIR